MFMNDRSFNADVADFPEFHVISLQVKLTTFVSRHTIRLMWFIYCDRGSSRPMNPTVFAMRRTDRKCPLWTHFDTGVEGTGWVRRLLRAWRSSRRPLKRNNLRNSRTQKWTIRSVTCSATMIFVVALFCGDLRAQEKICADIFSSSIHG